jgi:hypothetical protein
MPASAGPRPDPRLDTALAPPSPSSPKHQRSIASRTDTSRCKTAAPRRFRGSGTRARRALPTGTPERVHAASTDRTLARTQNVRQQARASRRSRCPALRPRPRPPAQYIRSWNFPRAVGGARCNDGARTRTDVPIWRAWRVSSADVLCARSVRGGQAQMGRSVRADPASEWLV